MLTDHWLGLFKALPEVGNTSILFLDETENLETQRMSADFKLLSICIDEFSRAAGVFNHA